MSAQQILTFGVLLAEALEALMAGTRFAADIIDTVNEGATLGQAIVTRAISAVEAVINAYNSNSGENRDRMLQGLSQETMNAILTELLEVMRQRGQALTVNDIQPLYNRAMDQLSILPQHNPAEWEAYEIEPPCNPTFKPRKIAQIPEGMDLYEIACPPRIAGENPKKACETKTKCCKRVKKNCKGKKLKRIKCCG